jgi:Ca2+-transporting ATPase
MAFTRYCLTGLYVGLATIGVFAQHYMSQGISLSELVNWSHCGTDWSPQGGAALCLVLFRESGRILPQMLALTTLVCMEMLKALSPVSVNNSIPRVGPQGHKWLLLGVSGPFLLHLLVLHSSKLGLPGLGEIFRMVRHTDLHLFSYFSKRPPQPLFLQVPLMKDDWCTVMAWALPIILVDEVLKAVGRYINQKKKEELTPGIETS